MNIGGLKEKRGLVAAVLLVVSLVAALLIVVKVAGFFVTSARAEGAVKQALAQSRPDAENLTAQIDRTKQLADALKKKNLFAPPPPKENPIKKVMGILGDEVLINGRWYKVGARVGDAKILAIGPDSVTTEWNGQQKTFNPIDGTGSGSSPPPKPGRRPSSSRSTRAAGRPSGAPSQLVITRRPTSNAVSGKVTRDTFAQLGANLGVRLSPRVQENLMKYWKGLSEKERAQSQERWNNMSDRERRQTLENAAREMR